MLIKKLNMLALILVFIDKNQMFEINQFMVNRGYAACPFTKWCGAEALKVPYNNTYRPCCSECSCDDDCHLLDVCCPDKKSKSSRVSHLLCKDTMTKKRNIFLDKTFHSGHRYGIRRYYITERCPENCTDSFIISKCEGENKTNIDDFLWVSDLNEGKIYQNYNCAMCHGVKDWITWQLRTNCINSLWFSFNSLSDLPFKDDCNIINEAPEAMAEVSGRYQCFIPDYFSCNQTGRWNHFDDDVESACQSYTQIYFKPSNFFFDMTVYKNVFCYLCNSEKNSTVDDVCPDPNGDTRGWDSNFNVLLDFRGRDQVPDAPICPLDEVFDLYMKRCRKLNCPLGSAPFYGKCDQIARNISGVAFQLGLRLKIVWERSSVPPKDTYNVTQLGKKVYDAIDTFLGLQVCGNCATPVYMESKNPRVENFIIYFNKRINPQCQLKFIHKRAANLVGKEVIVRLATTEHLTVSVSLEDDLFPGYFYLIDMHPSEICRVDLPINGYICPTIRLYYSDSFTLKDETIKQYFTSFFEDVKDFNESIHVDVCLENYWAKMSYGNGSVSCQIYMGDFPLALALMAYILWGMIL